MKHERIFLAVLVVLGLAVGLVVAEIGARFARQDRKAYMTSDPVLHHRLRRNVTRSVLGAEFSTNSLGFRDREYALDKPAGTFRILMQGDSFTEGGGLSAEQTMPKRVEVALAARCGGHYEVINAGTASYSPILEYVQLKYVGLTLHPDLVVLNFDMTDVHDDFVRTASAKLDARALPTAVPSDRRIESAILMPPIRKPAALRFLDPLERLLDRSRLWTLFRDSTVGAALVGSAKLTPERLAALGLVGNVQYDTEAITRDGDFPGMREAWRLTERYIVATRDLARDHGAAFALVVYPHAQQISAAESPDGRRRTGIGPGFYASRRPFDILVALGRRESFPVIDLLDLFRAREATDAPLFRRDDIHHTPAGARVFADGVLAGLLAAELVPCRAPAARR